MYINGTTPRTSADSTMPSYSNLNIEVYQLNEPIDRGDIIEAHIDHSVTIDGAKFLKSVCAFKVR